jgi:hypothetical protein
MPVRLAAGPSTAQRKESIFTDAFSRSWRSVPDLAVKLCHYTLPSNHAPRFW